MIELNKIYFEDCYDTLVKIDDGCVDLMLQDTPFGITQNEWDITPDFEKMWPEWLRVGKDNCAYLFFGTQPFVTDLINSNRKMFRYDVVWEKTSPQGFLNANTRPLRCHEHILVFSKRTHCYNPQKTFGHERKVSKLKHKHGSKKNENYADYGLRGYDSTQRFPRSVIQYSQDKQTSSLHPTQKPVDLIRHIIKTYSNEGELVFDGYMGSGTTAIACIEEKRKFLGSENKKEYFNICRKRIQVLNSSPKLL